MSKTTLHKERHGRWREHDRRVDAFMKPTASPRRGVTEVRNMTGARRNMTEAGNMTGARRNMTEVRNMTGARRNMTEAGNMTGASPVTTILRIDAGDE